ncbi:MAG: J domain-containing protein [Pseudomonadota bacterium]
MDSSKKNPFETLGLTPEIIIGLGEKELFSLVKSIYRALQKVYHPDHNRGKSPETAAECASRTVELNLAFEKLNLDKNPDSFKTNKKTYAARRSKGMRKKVAELENEIKRLREGRDSLADSYLAYLLRSLPWNVEAGEEPGRGPITPAGLKLGLNDVAINHNIRTVSWNLGSNYKEIIFDALGGLLYKPVGRSRPFPVNFIILLGAIDCRLIDLVPLMDRVPPRNGFFKSPALDSRYGIDGAPLQVLNTISLDKFKKYCLPLLSPSLTERSFLFSIHRPTFEEENRVTIEGVIVKITKL